ncbi:MAG: glycosyl transferase [Deltaproteobacteria bacterium HGW-Deltaproteobacteria-4]|nr:MAG: glycosyl transferase [Deltaproteobacteria bacterium HGW-Deltaproteobacteria-4]
MQISIITASYNAGATITDCLKSINFQTTPVEHLIIDGASTDNTLELVRQISPHARILSEPDRGIYDAMNKGIRLASGDIIGILNADDFYASPDVLAQVAAVFADPTVAACYGDLQYVQGGVGEKPTECFKVVRHWQSDPFCRSRFLWGWMPPHPTFFVRKEIYEQYGTFRLDLGSAADYELMLRLLFKHQIKAVYITQVLVKMRVGGVSNASLKNRITANLMDRRAWEVNGLKPYPWTLLMKPLRKLRQFLQR